MILCYLISALCEMYSTDGSRCCVLHKVIIYIKSIWFVKIIFNRYTCPLVLLTM